MRSRLSLLLLLAAATLDAAEPRRLPTGVFLDPAFPTHRTGNFPLAMALSPEGDRVVLLLCGWREQGIEVLDRSSGAVVQKLPQRAAFISLTFAPDGKTLYASGGNEDLVHVYRWENGQAMADGTIVLREKPPQAKSGTSYPAGIAISPDGKFLYAAENLGDSLAVVDLASRNVVQRLDTGRYPYGVAADDHGNVYVSCWGANTVDVFRSEGKPLARRASVEVARHPSALLLNRDASRLYVASATTDSVAVLATKDLRLLPPMRDAAPGAPEEGSTPNALALSADGRRLFVAEADNNAVAVFDAAAGRLLGRIPAEWYPSALVRAGDSIVVANAKGNGTAPNPQRPQPDQRMQPGERSYTLGQLDGSLMSFPAAIPEAQLRSLTARAARANGWSRSTAARRYPPFKHVIYVIKENRTYDQILGDLPAGDGDPSLLFFDRSSAPNHHALAERFGIFDRFFVNAEVSAQGHNWSTAAYGTDYLEKTTPSEYSGRGRTYDYEGTNRAKMTPDEEDVNAPSTGYLWDVAARAGITYRDYGEFVVFPAKKGEVGEAESGEGEVIPTKQALAGHFAPKYPPFGLDIMDQTRADRWMEEFEQFVATGELPAFEIVRLPNDHTMGAAAGKRTPRAYMADNDLALARIVSAVSRSRYWRDTVLFVLEDDAQSGPDHVDSHRSVLMVISAYNRPGVVHRFVNTTDVLATMEDILGMRSLSQFDHFGRPLRGLFASTPDLRPYMPIVPSVALNELNPPGPAAKQSALLDLSRVDAADEDLFNRILWRTIKGDVPYPGPTRAPVADLVGR